jgi:glycosyltransferase involved in cell wall biosynthesis
MAIPDMSSPPLRVVVLMPVRDDWVSAAELVRSLDRTVSAGHANVSLEVLMVDDGSIESCLSVRVEAPFAIVRTVQVLRLRRNLGHQRAIAVGLVHIEEAMPSDAVLVMDADGEDTPDGALQLIREFSAAEGKTLIFAERARRVESLTFRTFYQVYKVVHRALTGISVRVGNFSILPRSYLGTLTVLAELWNHYAAAVFRSQLRFTMIPIPRGRRIAGTSRMNFVSLVTHGLSAVSVFADVVGVRLLIGSLAGSLIAAIGIVTVVVIRLFTNQAIPGWATYAAGTLSIILIQMVTIATCFTFFMLSARTALGFVPRRDVQFFVDEVINIYPHD